MATPGTTLAVVVIFIPTSPFTNQISLPIRETELGGDRFHG